MKIFTLCFALIAAAFGIALAGCDCNPCHNGSCCVCKCGCANCGTGCCEKPCCDKCTCATGCCVDK